MANDIIKQLEEATTGITTIQGVTMTRFPSSNFFKGTAEALIAAGLVTAAQLPGQPGMPKTSVTFYKGQQTTKRAGGVGYLQIRRSTKTVFCVTVRVSKEEESKRWKEIKKNNEASRRSLAKDATTLFSETEYRAMAENLVMMIWRLARTEERAEPDSFPFELDDNNAQKLSNTLKEIRAIFKDGEVQEVHPSRGDFLKARKDAVFQSFLRSQCINVEGHSHA